MLALYLVAFRIIILQIFNSYVYLWSSFDEITQEYNIHGIKYHLQIILALLNDEMDYLCSVVMTVLYVNLHSEIRTFVRRFWENELINIMLTTVV